MWLCCWGDTLPGAQPCVTGFPGLVGNEHMSRAVGAITPVVLLLSVGSLWLQIVCSLTCVNPCSGVDWGDISPPTPQVSGTFLCVALSFLVLCPAHSSCYCFPEYQRCFFLSGLCLLCLGPSSALWPGSSPHCRLRDQDASHFFLPSAIIVPWCCCPVSEHTVSGLLSVSQLFEVGDSIPLLLSWMQVDVLLWQFLIPPSSSVLTGLRPLGCQKESVVTLFTYHWNLCTGRPPWSGHSLGQSRALSNDWYFLSSRLSFESTYFLWNSCSGKLSWVSK